MSIVESMLFVLGYTLTCIGIGFALGLAIGNINNTKKMTTALFRSVGRHFLT